MSGPFGVCVGVGLRVGYIIINVGPLHIVMAIIIVRHHHQVYPLLSSWLESRTRVSLVVKEKLKWTPPKNLPTEKKKGSAK